MALMIECDNLVKIYKTREIEVVALQGLDLAVEEGEMIAIIGNSGSGKSTLLNMLGGLDTPSAGRLVVGGRDLIKAKPAELIDYKRKIVGFVWQNNARNLIPYLTARENIELPMLLNHANRRSKALELLKRVGLLHRSNNTLAQLSGGEQQRVAIALALANDPKILLADEPTGAVDSQTAMDILDLMRQLSYENGTTIVIVTHDMQLSRKVDRVVAIRDGRTSSEFIRRNSYREEMDTIGHVLQGDDEQADHVELTILDQAGRLQIPSNYLRALGIEGRGRVSVELEGEHIVISTPEHAQQVQVSVQNPNI